MTELRQAGADAGRAAEKEALRDAMRKRRHAEPDGARLRASERVCAKLLSRDLGWPVAVYLAVGDELDLSPFILSSLAASRPLLAPRWNGSSYELSPLKGLGAGDVRKGPMGVLEPVAAPPEGLDAPRTWLVPGLAFTRDGRRLGYGGGWYDRMLSNARPDASAIGVAYAFQIVGDLPAEPHDVSLSSVVCDGDDGHLL